MINVINEKELFKINKSSDLKIEQRKINGTDVPIIIVDNLYVNPEEVREISFTLPYTKSKSILLNSPGKRVKLDLDIKNFNDVDFIHISHIHPDHCHDETLKCLPNNIPILIHNWDDKFVKMNLERMGKKVIEVEHGEKYKLSKDI